MDTVETQPASVLATLAPDGATTAPAVDPGFPIPAGAFVRQLRGTSDEIWSHLLQLEYGGQNKLLADWQAVLADLKARKV